MTCVLVHRRWRRNATRGHAIPKWLPANCAQGTGVVLRAEIVFVAYLGVPDIDQSGDNLRRGHEAQALAVCAERVRLCAR
jgi:hypothetical protein